VSDGAPGGGEALVADDTGTAEVLERDGPVEHDAGGGVIVARPALARPCVRRGGAHACPAVADFAHGDIAGAPSNERCSGGHAYVCVLAVVSHGAVLVLRRRSRRAPRTRVAFIATSSRSM
jgi:hypothetical protein